MSSQIANTKAVLELLCSYESRDPIRRYLHTQRRRLIANLIRSHGSGQGHALDVGFGIGTYSPYLLRRFGRVTCIDNNPELIEYARGRFPSNGRLNLAQADVAALPFRDATFDFILCSEVLEHVRAPRKALQEFLRVKKKSARLVLSIPQRFSLPEVTAQVFFSRPLRGLVRAILHEPVYDCGHVSLMTSGKALSLLKQTGFVVEKARYTGAFVPLVSHVLPRRWIPVMRRLETCWQREPWRSLLWTQIYVLR